MTGESIKKEKDSGKKERSGSILGRLRKPSGYGGSSKKRFTKSTEDLTEEGDGVCDTCRPVPLPGHKAAYLGHLDCLAALRRDAPGKLKALDRNGATPLHLAVRQMNVDAVLWFIHNCAEFRRTAAHGGETPVLIAAAQGSRECLEVLTESEKDQTVRHAMIMDTDSQGLSSIHLAALKDREECVTWLIKHFGIKIVQAQTQSGITPVHIAAATGHLGVLKALTKKNKKGATFVDAAGTTPAYFAAQEGQLETLQYLVEVCKVDAMARCDDGMTSMHAAAQGGYLHIVQWLVDTLGGEAIIQRTRDHATPIHFAAAMGHEEVLRWMLSQPKAQGAVNMADADLGTPAHDAADNGHLECLRILKANGAHLLAEDKEGSTPLSLALQSDDPDCRLWAREQQQAMDEDTLRRPSRIEADAILSAELTKLALEVQKSQTLPGRQPRAASPHPLSRQKRPSSERIQAPNSSDLYAVPSRLVKKRWDGGTSPMPANAPKLSTADLQPQAAKPIESDHESDFESAGQVLQESQTKKDSTAYEPPDLPPRTPASSQIAERDGESPDKQTAETAIDKEECNGATAEEETLSDKQIVSAPQRPLTLTPTKMAAPRPRPQSARTHSDHIQNQETSRHSAPGSPVTIKPEGGSQPGTPTFPRTNYPRLTRVGLFDLPTKSANSSPTGSPLPSPLVVRRPFNFAAKPAGSPTLERSHSMPQSPMKEKSALLGGNVKKSNSLGSADTHSMNFEKPAKIAKLLRDDDENDALGEVSP